jgi:nucleoside-diphosphate-sugar epimerase
LPVRTRPLQRWRLSAPRCTGAPSTISTAATASGGVTHLAYKIEEIRSGNFEGANDADVGAIEALGAALAGTDKPFVGTSITLTLTFSGVAGVGTESDAATAGPRAEAENAMIALAERGVRSSVVRLPPTVYGSLDHKGAIPGLIGIARGKGHARSVGDGSNRSFAVHTLDAAHLYCLTIEGAPAGHDCTPSPTRVPFHEIAEAIGRNLDLPTVSISPDGVAAYFGYLSWAVSLDSPTSSALAQKLLGWTPTRPVGIACEPGQGPRTRRCAAGPLLGDLVARTEMTRAELGQRAVG